MYLSNSNSHFYRHYFFHCHLPGQEICCFYKNVLAVVYLPSAGLNAVLSALTGLISDAGLCGHQTKKIQLLGLMCQLCFWWSCGDSDLPPPCSAVCVGGDVGQRFCSTAFCLLGRKRRVVQFILLPLMH